MIEELMVAKTATFFGVRHRLSENAINDLFRSIRAGRISPGHNHFCHVREQEATSRWSAICFSYESPPAFLEPSTSLTELLCGYLLLVEHEDHVAVFSSRLTLPSSFKSRYLAPIPMARVEAATAKGDAVFQKLRLRNMSISRYTMRNKTLEAADLSNVVGPSGSRRYVPQAYTATLEGTLTTATPSTGRISIRSDRAPYEELIAFAEAIIHELRTNPDTVSPFIRSFARPATLADALATGQPITMAIQTSRILNALNSDNVSIRLVRGGGHPIQLNQGDLDKLIRTLEQPLEIRGDQKMRFAYLPGTDEQAATISLNKSRIALRSLDLPALADVGVELASVPLGQDPERRPLGKYLDEENALIVLFDDARLAYLDGSIFRDETMLDGGANFLRYFHVEPALAAVTSEKGEFTNTQTAFSPTSTFGVVVNHVAADDTILVCDDLHEWADFIGVRTSVGITKVTFYHAKHGSLGLGGSQFHVSVGQAIKNLGNMSFPAEQMPGKLAFWANTYNLNNQQTQIARTIRNNTPDLGAALAETRNAPDILRQAVIVTSSISRQAIQAALTELQNGGHPSPDFVQLYWLLQSFFSACTEVGAIGAVVCQP